MLFVDGDFIRELKGHSVATLAHLESSNSGWPSLSDDGGIYVGVSAAILHLR